MNICVLNLGLKSVRAAVFDLEGHRLAIAYRPIETRLGEGQVEQLPDAWWGACLATLDEVFADSRLAGDVGIITVTASAGCLVTLDRERVALGPAIMISDVRAQPQAERIAGMSGFAHLAAAGRRVTADQMLPKILWLREHERERFDRTRWFASPNDFLVLRLTGQLVTDRANASKYFHDATTGYPRPLLAEIGVEEDRLPPVDDRLELAPLPELSERYGLPSGARVVLSSYDAICAIYGAGVTRPGDACDVSGTVTSFRVVTDKPVADRSGSIFVAPHIRPGYFLAGGSNNLAGGTVEWAKQLLYSGEPDPYGAMEAEANDAPPGAGGIVFLPYLLGERAPIWDASARAVFFGLGRSHVRADLVRAVFEGVGYSVLDIAEHLRSLGLPIEHVSASGGLARLEPIRQIKADMLGVPLSLPEELETTALGAALLAAVKQGCFASVDEAISASVRWSARYEPDPRRTEMYRDFFGLYRGLYSRLREAFRERDILLARHAETLRSQPARAANL